MNKWLIADGAPEEPKCAALQGPERNPLTLTVTERGTTTGERPPPMNLKSMSLVDKFSGLWCKTMNQKNSFGTSVITASTPQDVTGRSTVGEDKDMFTSSGGLITVEGIHLPLTLQKKDGPYKGVKG